MAMCRCKGKILDITESNRRHIHPFIFVGAACAVTFPLTRSRNALHASLGRPLALAGPLRSTLHLLG